jgi:hypothetical protein
MSPEAWDPVAQLTARLAVRATIDGYALACDRGAVDVVVAFFTVDGVLEAPQVGVRAEGQESLRRAFAGFGRRRSSAGVPPVASLQHHVTTSCVTGLGPALATATSYYVVLTDAGPDHWGRWVDVLVPEPSGGGTWLLAERQAFIDGAVPGSWSTWPAGGARH